MQAGEDAWLSPTRDPRLIPLGGPAQRMAQRRGGQGRRKAGRGGQGRGEASSPVRRQAHCRRKGEAASPVRHQARRRRGQGEVEGEGT